MMRCQRRGCGLPLHIEVYEAHTPGLYHIVAYRDDTKRIHLLLRTKGRGGCPKPTTTAP